MARDAVGTFSPTPGARDARLVRSRAALTGALLALLQDKPFEAITIREITARAGLGYATFFRHYPAKDALLADIASAEIAALLAMIVPSLQSADSGKSTLALCAWVDERRALWSALLTGGAAEPVRSEFIRQARLLPNTGGPGDSWLPADLGVVHGAGGTIAVLAWWLAQPMEFPVERIAAILDRLIIAPLLHRPGGERAD